MASSNIKLFDENKGNMLSDSEFSISTQRLNGLQTGVASSQLQNKAMYQASLVAYAIAQVMMQNGKNANDTDAVSAFVANLSGAMLQKVYDLASTEEAKAGTATGKWMSPALVKAFFDYMEATTSEAQAGTNNTKWMSPALVKAAIDTLAAKAQNILSDTTKVLYGLDSSAVPDDAFRKIMKTELTVASKTGSTVTCTKGTTVLTKTAVNDACLFIIPEYGEWTISNEDGTELVTVDTVKQYYVNLLFNYGDGSKNTVVSGYVGVLQLNGADATTVSVGSNTSGNYINALYPNGNPGNNDPWKVMTEKAIGATAIARIISGLQTYDFEVDATSQAMSVMHQINCGSEGAEAIGNLKYEVNGTFYTLSELVSEGIIKPLVLIVSCSPNGAYYFKNVLNIYTGGTSDTSTYPSSAIIFMLNRGYKITRSQWYTTKGGSSASDSLGWKLFYAPTTDYRLTIKE